MISFENQSQQKTDFDENEKVRIDKKAELDAAMAAEDYAKVASLSAEMGGLKKNKEELIGNAQEDAEAEDRLRQEDFGAEMAKDTEAEIAAKELADLKLKDETESAEKAEDILKQINGEVLGEKTESTQELPAGVQKVIDKMKNDGNYEDEIANLKPGEAPSSELTTNMIYTVLMSGNVYSLDLAQTLMENLPFDSEGVSKCAEKEVMDNAYLDERHLKILEIAGIEPASLHDKALEKIPYRLQLVAGSRGEIIHPEDVEKWRETFGISDDEYASALKEYYEKNHVNISQEHLQQLGFLKTKNGNSDGWAWETSK